MIEATREVSEARGIRRALLHRPDPPSGSLARPRLSAQLDHALVLPAGVVCAPAGFGKTVAVSEWCESLDLPHAWLSLDRSVDDLHWFVLHLVAAVREAYPTAFPVVSQMANGAELPPLDAVLVELSNEFDELPGPIVVVLDDFHHVTSPDCVQIISDLLRHPPESVHFVIVSRQEPPTSIGMLRAIGLVAELRMDELAFTPAEVAALTRQDLGRELAADRVDELFRSTEGWPTGVRLAIEALRHTTNDEIVVGAGFLDHAAQEYLVTELLDRTPPQVRRHLLGASLFDRFNAELCDAVAGVMTDGHPLMTGPEFIDWVRRNGLFIVALDPDGGWFRFHHLFAQLIATWRRASHTDPEFAEAEMRRAAAGVFRAHGMFEEAIEQLHLVGDHRAIASMAVERGRQLIERERWRELARLLDSTPQTIIDNNADLLLLRAWWLAHTQARYREMTNALTSVEALIEHGDGDQQANRRRRGQIAELRAAYEALPSGDIESAIDEADTACELLATTPSRELAFAYLIATVARTVAGRFNEAHAVAYSVVGDPRFAGSANDPMIWAMPYLGWLEGDLTLTERFGAQLQDVGQRFDLRDAVPGAAFFLGRAAYERNQLTTAESNLRRVVDRRFSTRPLFLVHAWIALALTELAQGRGRDADSTASSMMQFVLSIRTEYFQPVAETFLAELDLRRGRRAAALRWAERAGSDTPSAGWPMFFDPCPTLVEVLLSSDSEAEVARGRRLLDDQLALAERRHHYPRTLRLLGLRALDLASCGDEPGALDALRDAVTMSQRSGMIRRLADLGPPLAPLLHRLDVADELLAHVGVILAALEPANAIADPGTGTRSGHDTVRAVSHVAGQPCLTGRELDVLVMLADRYSNKEIARKLLIAPATVKKHTVTLYDKLNVHGRKQAVAKARTLGYLPD